MAAATPHRQRIGWRAQHAAAAGGDDTGRSAPVSFDAEGFLLLDLANSGNRLRLSGFDPMNPLGPRAVERFRFGAQGNEIGYEALLARGFDIIGTHQEDTLTGTALSDRVWGGDGNDLIEATAGGDWLAGQPATISTSSAWAMARVTIDDLALTRPATCCASDQASLPTRCAMHCASNPLAAAAICCASLRWRGRPGAAVSASIHTMCWTAHAVDRFRFADGTAVDYATLVSWTASWSRGDSAGNALTGTNVGDRLYGYDSGDLLEAGGGEDV